MRGGGYPGLPPIRPFLDRAAAYSCGTAPDFNRLPLFASQASGPEESATQILLWSLDYRLGQEPKAKGPRRAPLRRVICSAYLPLPPETPAGIRESELSPPVAPESGAPSR